MLGRASDLQGDVADPLRTTTPGVGEGGRGGLPNLRARRRADDQTVAQATPSLGIWLTRAGLALSRPPRALHQGMLIEPHDARDRRHQVNPAALSYSGALRSGREREAAGIKNPPQVECELGERRDHGSPGGARGDEQGDRQGRGHARRHREAGGAAPRRADTMAARVLRCAPVCADDTWPLPKYREMLFPV